MLFGLLGDPTKTAADITAEVDYELGWLQGQACLLQAEADQLDAEVQPQLRAACAQSDYDTAAFEGRKGFLPRDLE